MSISRLLSVLVALALIFAPSAASARGSASMASAPHEMTMPDAGHCDSMPAEPAGHQASDKSCCGAMCLGLAVMPAMPLAERQVPRMVALASACGSLDGLPSELATPPPRHA